jgi:hypothetical protein
LWRSAIAMLDGTHDWGTRATGGVCAVEGEREGATDGSYCPPMKQGVDGGHDELVDIVASLLHG